MKKLSFWKVVKRNIKCALCDNDKCEIRYYPNLEKIELITGGDWLRKVIKKCPKMVEKQKKKLLNKKIP